MNGNKFADSCFCGSMTFCVVMVLLVVFGVPLFISGVALTSLFGTDGNSAPSVAGKTMLTIACLMAAAGLVAVFYMCRMGPKLLKTTPAPKKNKQPKKQTYQQFTSGNRDDAHPAPPAYEDSSNHRQFYPSSPNPTPNYKPTTQPQANYQGNYPQHGNYQGNYPQHGNYSQQGNYQHQMMPQQQEHSANWRSHNSSSAHQCPPEPTLPYAPYAATAPPYGGATNWSPATATPSAPPLPPPAYGSAPPCANAGPLPMKI